MTIRALLKVLAPPTAPFEPFSGPWAPVEAALRTPLPEDYKDFVRIYGSGQFLDFFGLYIPGSRNPNLRLESAVRMVCQSLRQLKDFAYALWPAPGGLIPIGQTDNGDYIFWLPNAEPADWKVVIWDRGFGDFEIFDCELTDVLAGLVTGAVLPAAFPDDLLPCESLFSPDSPDPPLDCAGQIPVGFSLTWRLGSFSGVSRCRLRLAHRSG
jgi:hypothetical protein